MHRPSDPPDISTLKDLCIPNTVMPPYTIHSFYKNVPNICYSLNTGDTAVNKTDEKYSHPCRAYILVERDRE